MKKDVKQLIVPGLWVDHQDQLHFDASEFLQSQNIPDTEENRLTIEEELKQIVREEIPLVPIVTLFDA